MKNKIANSFLILSALFLSSTTWAQSAPDKSLVQGYYFDETFFPVYINENNTESDAGGSASASVATQKGWGIDTHTTFGYVWENILFGATYNYYSIKSSRPVTADYEGLQEFTGKNEWGLTLGYFLGHWRITFTEFLYAKKVFTQTYTSPTTGQPDSDETHIDAGGSGYQIALGYDFMLGGGFGISPTLLYHNVTYTQQAFQVRAGTSTPYPMGPLQTNAIDSELDPMITVSYWF
jgi:hypothetical protein